MKNTDSILKSVKKELGLFEDDTSFDSSVYMNINMAFMILHGLGVGPEEPFEINNDETTWTDFFNDVGIVNGVKTYVWIRTKLNFDPPETSFGITALEKQASELEWRLCSQMKDV